MKELIKLHDKIKNHKFRINRKTQYSKSYGNLLRELILLFYQKTKGTEMGLYIHEALSTAWHFQDGDDSYTEYYKDGAKMDRDIMLSAELIIGDIHRYIINKDLTKLHTYYTGCNTHGSRKSTLVWNGKSYDFVKGWK